ncbi:hypothetical protein AVEN_93968-1 [Araneus ventricosus]|uniref:Uncharacterized protein n=1 Tax=Araneus ventricosus TaxID=182803 RepID=A0A4Y2CLE5_ARAVE|nr:hypothetical protein AVEN_93968-1 [Araneus ventricosus]
MQNSIQVRVVNAEIVNTKRKLLSIISKTLEECVNLQLNWPKDIFLNQSQNIGGVCESSIKLAKRHLLKPCEGHLLTFEELFTPLCQIESCINSRPLSPLSNDPSYFMTLTPGHYLTGEPLLELPQADDVSNQTISFSSRFRSLLQMKECFGAGGPGTSCITCSPDCNGRNTVLPS